jgi:hypothetical protein
MALVGACAAFVACGLDVGGSLVASGDDASSPVDSGGHDVTITEGGGQDGPLSDGTAIDGTSTDGTASDGTVDGTTPDASMDAGVDSAADASRDADASPVDAPPDAPSCTTVNGCYIVPSGWNLVALDTANQTAACPSGFAQAAPVDVVEGPNVGANACGCQSCSIGMQPSCASGAVKVMYDVGGGGCGLNGVPPQNNNNPPGGCDTDMYMGSENNLDAKLTPPGPTGGMCTSAGRVDKQNVTYAGQARTCAPDNAAAAGCVGNECTPNLVAPYSACIAKAGIQTCPSPFTTKHLVGTDVNYTCGPCPCSVGATCTGTMTLYRNGNCTGGTLVLTVDDVCRPTNDNQSYSSYKYAGTASNVSCSVGAAPAAQNVTLVGEETICCAP